MSKSSNAKTALVGRVWRLMFDFLIRTGPERSRILARRGLTPNDSRALTSLDPHEGKTMRSLAEKWECDASNATWIVDRLEGLGLAERRTIAHDRRVKLVVLTAKGQKTKDELRKELHTPPQDLFKLDREDLESLQQALEKLHLPAVPPGADDRTVRKAKKA